METKCGHKVLFGDMSWAMTGCAWEELTNAPTILVIFVSQNILNVYYGLDIEKDYYQICRYENKTRNGASFKLEKLKGELKIIIDAKIKTDNKRAGSQSD